MKNITSETKQLANRNSILRSRLGNQDGIVLVTALVFLLMLAVFAAVAVEWSAPDIKRTKDYTKTRSAFYLAEAGIQRAVSFFNYDSSGNSPGEVDDGFDDEIDGTNWPAGTFSNVTVGSGGGTFTVTVADNDDDDSDTDVDVDKSVVLTSTGTIDGVTSSIEAVIFRPLFKSEHALATDGDLTINGNPTIQGTNGSVHANADLSVTGNPSISQTATASGTYTETGNPTVSGGSSGGTSNSEIPTVIISDYKTYADYVLTSDGKVKNSAGTVIHTCSTDGKWGDPTPSGCNGGGKGWDCSPGPPIEWTLGDSCAYEGNYYVEGSIKIGGNPGSPSDPWDVTLMAEDHIVISGNPNFVNYGDPADPEEIQNIFFLAGTDIQWSGNPSNTIQGMIYAGEQIKLNGNPTINGFILAKNAGDTDETVKATDQGVSGNPVITYNGDLVSPFLSNKITIISWQEL